MGDQSKRVASFEVPCRGGSRELQPSVAGSRCVVDINAHGSRQMNAIIYLVGLVVIVMAILSFIGLR
jgi:hypothetical protein